MPLFSKVDLHIARSCAKYNTVSHAHIYCRGGVEKYYQFFLVGSNKGLGRGINLLNWENNKCGRI